MSQQPREQTCVHTAHSTQHKQHKAQPYIFVGMQERERGKNGEHSTAAQIADGVRALEANLYPVVGWQRAVQVATCQALVQRLQHAVVGLVGHVHWCCCSRKYLITLPLCLWSAVEHPIISQRSPRIAPRTPFAFVPQQAHPVLAARTCPCSLPLAQLH